MSHDPPEAEAVYVERVEDVFRRLRGAPLLLSPADFERVLTWHREGVPLFVVEGALEDVFRRAAERRPPRTPRSLRYCEPAVRDAFDAWKDGRHGARVTGALPPEGPEIVAAAVVALHASRAPRGARERATERLLRLAATPAVPGEDRIAALVAELVDACLGTLAADERAALEAEAEADLAPYADTMSDTVRNGARRAALVRRVRRRFDLPDLAALPLL